MHANSIKNWAEDDRPREKLVLKGTTSLSNAELLAIILGSGTRDLSAVQVAQGLLNCFNNDLTALGKSTVSDLVQYPGIGTAKASEIVAVMELSRRRRNEKKSVNPIVRGSSDAFNILSQYFEDLEHEEFYALYLNRSNKVIAVEQISRGGITGTVADGKVIFNHALRLKACGIILAHNHPSGNNKPSEADYQLTQSLQKFGKYIDVHVLDHIIMAGNTYFSFADEGKLNS